MLHLPGACVTPAIPLALLLNSGDLIKKKRFWCGSPHCPSPPRSPGELPEPRAHCAHTAQTMCFCGVVSGDPISRHFWACTRDLPVCVRGGRFTGYTLGKPPPPPVRTPGHALPHVRTPHSVSVRTPGGLVLAAPGGGGACGCGSHPAASPRDRVRGPVPPPPPAVCGLGRGLPQIRRRITANHDEEGQMMAILENANTGGCVCVWDKRSPAAALLRDSERLLACIPVSGRRRCAVAGTGLNKIVPRE